MARALAWVVRQAKATRDKMHVLAEECARGFEGGQMPLQRRLPNMVLKMRCSKSAMALSTWILSRKLLKVQIISAWMTFTIVAW